MTMNTVRETAKIYEFPVKNQRRLDEMRLREMLVRPTIYESFGGSWYHEEALREAEAKPKQ